MHVRNATNLDLSTGSGCVTLFLAVQTIATPLAEGRGTSVMLKMMIAGAVCFLLAACAMPPAPPASQRASMNANPSSENLNAALIEAASKGDLDAVKSHIAQGASVQATDGAGRTALIAAAYGNHVEVARALIDAGADVNTQDNTKQSAYLIPTADGGLEMLQLTLANGADVHSLDSYNGTGLIRAADRGHADIIRELLKTDIKIDHVNRLGWTALLEAIILGDGGERHTEVVRLLVDAGANVNLADSAGVTPLAHAKQRGFADIISILESAGAQ
jgi:ankyrin repeat protein